MTLKMGNAAVTSGGVQETRPKHNANRRKTPPVRARRYCLRDSASDVVMVLRCSFCQQPHRHLTSRPGTTFERHPRCRPWRTYLVHIVEIVPSSASIPAPRTEVTAVTA
jgi:hypothetical protein